MEKLLKISIDIENLERENMTPILSEMGMNFDPKEIQDDIAQNNPRPVSYTHLDVYKRQHKFYLSQKVQLISLENNLWIISIP